MKERNQGQGVECRLDWQSGKSLRNRCLNWGIEAFQAGETEVQWSYAGGSVFYIRTRKKASGAGALWQGDVLGGHRIRQKPGRTGS